uniref:Uncharacterized protein n=1 Tax=Kalanchoe fedtschenkoi TaxID=63787 RepID=A0A7N0UAR5_KALFE
MDQQKSAPPPAAPYHPQVETPWSTGLCDCCQDASNCCITCWCPCITFGQISEIVDQGSSCKHPFFIFLKKLLYFIHTINQNHHQGLNNSGCEKLITFCVACATNGALYCLLAYFTGCGCLFSCIYRSKMRRQYMLQDNACGDLCTHFCCESCALCQEYRELKHRGFDMSLGWRENMERRGHGGVQVAPTAPYGMTR